jgi:hypothetical protein
VTGSLPVTGKPKRPVTSKPFCSSDDDDPDEVQRVGDDDGDNLPSPGRNSPGRFLPARELFSLIVFRPAEAAVSISDPPLLRFSGTII